MQRYEKPHKYEMTNTHKVHGYGGGQIRDFIHKLPVLPELTTKFPRQNSFSGITFWVAW